MNGQPVLMVHDCGCCTAAAADGMVRLECDCDGRCWYPIHRGRYAPGLGTSVTLEADR